MRWLVGGGGAREGAGGARRWRWRGAAPGAPTHPDGTSGPPRSRLRGGSSSSGSGVRWRGIAIEI